MTVPQYGLRLYDWVISLEVVEHIPSTYEDIVLGNLVRHARRGLILSWARPGQGGRGHVNERPDSYVEAKLETLGFERRNKKSMILQEAASLAWLKNNVFVYERRRDRPANPDDV